MKNMNNNAQLIGYAGDNPIVKSLESGKKAATFQVATHNRYIDKTTGDRIENTTWHRVVAWGKTADIVERFVKKGSQLIVTGEISNRTYTKKIKGVKDPITMYTTDIIIDSIRVL